jgi:hypothetical protein
MRKGFFFFFLLVFFASAAAGDLALPYFKTGSKIVPNFEAGQGVLASADWVIPYDFKEGINYFSLPYIGAVLDSGENIVENLGQLGDEINRQAGEDTVLSIGYWDSEAQEAKGIRFDYAAVDKYVPIKGITATEPVLPGRTYVVSVSKSFQFVINLSFAQYE